MKILCYGVRAVEEPIFNKVNERFNYELTYVPYLLTHENVDDVKGYDAILLRANCVADRQNLEIIKNKYKIQYVFTRTAGTNHIDLEAAKELGIHVAYVPVYSPNAISELALAFALDLSRHSLYTAVKTSKMDFTLDNYMFSKELRNSTVGIIGLGNIGLTTAKLFHGVGATVIGNDVSDKGVDYIEQYSLEELAEKSDIIILHCPFIPGVNENIINADLIAKMKDGAIVINVARGELVDMRAMIDAIKSDKLHGFATDVVKNETLTFGKKFTSEDEMVPEVAELVSLFPRVLMAPHIGSYTDEAVKNMVEYSFENLEDILNGTENKRILF